MPAVAPLQSLTLTLLHGQEALHTQTYSQGVPGPQEASATHSATARSEDGLRNFSCLAELDLRPVGGSVIRQVSEPQVLQIYGEEGPRVGGVRAERVFISSGEAESHFLSCVSPRGLWLCWLRKLY